MHTIKFGHLTRCKKVMVLSDLHIGDPRVEKRRLSLLCTTIKLEKPDVLVLAGDVLEGDLASDEQKEQLMEACRSADQIIVLKGNHDSEATKRFAYIVEATFGECVTGFSRDSSYVIEHGNRFDSAWKRVPGLGHLAVWLNRVIYRVTKFDVQKWFRKFRCVEKKLKKQHDKAWDAWPDDDIVVTGHTHIPLGNVLGEGYFNSGDWLYHKTYVVINQGRARLEYFQ
jgi:predicted phosphodiesterase